MNHEFSEGGAAQPFAPKVRACEPFVREKGFIMVSQWLTLAAVHGMAVNIMAADGAAAAALAAPAAAEGVRLAAVTPPDGYIDPRRPAPGTADAAGGGGLRIVLEFSAAVMLDIEDIEVSATGGAAPAAAGLEGASGDRVWTLELSGPLPEGEYTHVTVGDYGTLTYGAVPGDVDQDGAATPADYDAMELAMASSAADPRYYDINGDGAVNIDDVEPLIGIVADGIPYACCVYSNDCELYLGTSTCPTGTTQVTCPCPDPPGN